MSESPFDRLIAALDAAGSKPKVRGEKATVLCPAHEDRNPSLSVSQGNDGRVLVKCHAGCENEQVVTALGLGMSDLFADRGGIGYTPVPGATAPPAGLTVEAYAKAKGLPVEFLRSVGVGEMYYSGAPAVSFSYRAEDGEESAAKFRLDMEGDFRWRHGDKPHLYGLDRLDLAVDYVILVEGESDTQTLWYRGYNALGVPGAGGWREQRDASVVEGFATVYLIREPDSGGDLLVESLAESKIADQIRVVSLAPFKDPSEMWLDSPEEFDGRLRKALDAARPIGEVVDATEEVDREGLWEKCRDIATSGRILDLFVAAAEKAGVVGERTILILLYLAITSRLLARPVSVAVAGVSAGGKSYLVETTLRFFPDEAYLAFTTMSEMALVYLDDDLRHRFVVLYEVGGLRSVEGVKTYMVRSLLSEGHLKHSTVENVGGEFRTRTVEKEGPTGLLVTTTATHLDAELETRMLTATVTDSPAQTRSVIRRLAQESIKEPDADEWHSFQAWLALGPTTVTIPYASQIAEAIPAVAVRLRRDFTTVLTLIKAHALLHQETRRRDSSGGVVATIEDYRVVWELLEPLISVGVEATVSPEIRETVAAVARLKAEDSGRQIDYKQLGEALNLEKSTARRRAIKAIELGFLINKANKGRPADLHLGDPLPDDLSVLPDPDLLSEEE